MLRGHLYPSTIAQLPWSADLEAASGRLEALREPFFGACRRRFEAEAELERLADGLGLRPLREVVRLNAPRESLNFSVHFDDEEPFTVSMPQVGEIESAGHDDDPHFDDGALVVSGDGHALTFPSAEIACLAAAAFRLANGKEVTRASILRLPTPPDASTCERLTALLAEFAPDALERAVFEQVDQIDDVVGPALGLSAAEIEFVKREMESDPFLSRVRPRYPYFTAALRGRRVSLEQGERYGEA
jgi:hypothetical protein